MNSQIVITIECDPPLALGTKLTVKTYTQGVETGSVEKSQMIEKSQMREEPLPDKQAYTVAEAAKLFQPPVSPVTIYRSVYAGNLKVLKGFGRMLIPRSELEKFFGRVVSYEEKMLPKRKRRRESKKYGA